MAAGIQSDKKGGSSGAGGKRKIDSLPSGDRGRPYKSKKQKLSQRGNVRKENEQQGTTDAVAADKAVPPRKNKAKYSKDRGHKLNEARPDRTAEAKAATGPKAAQQAVRKGSSGGAGKTEKQQQLQEAVSKWEKLRRHDTNAEERSQLITAVLGQVEGRVANVASSPTGSRVLQTCAKHGTPEQRKKLLQQVMPQLLELSKSAYAHFLVCKLIAMAPKFDIPGILSAVKGHVAVLLRHPCGAAVIDELYNSASAQQRNHLAAEFYGKEYTLLSQEAAPTHLADLLGTVDAAKRRIILQRMAVQLIPLMEKALVDPMLAHRLIAEYLQASVPSARAEAIEALAGEPLLRMVHTRDGAWAAVAVLRYGTAKDCKKFVKAMKGHVETMAKDRWGSLVLAAALSHVDDTVLLRKIVLPPLQAKLEDLLQDKHARLVFLQLLVPDKPRYLQAELLSVVHPVADHTSHPATASEHADNAAAAGTDAEAVDGDADAGSTKAASQQKDQRRKDPKLRQKELLGAEGKGLAANLLSTAAVNVSQFLQSATASDVVVELAVGASNGVLAEEHEPGLKALQDAVVAEVSRSQEDGNEAAVDTVYGSRALRRMILASQEEGYSTGVAKKLADLLWPVFKGKSEQLKDGHAKKVLEAFAKQGHT